MLDAILQRPWIVPYLLTEAAALGGDLADVEVVVGAEEPNELACGHRPTGCGR